MKKKKNILTVSREFNIRFSRSGLNELRLARGLLIVFRRCREAFGDKYGLGYLLIFNSGYYAPLVDLSFQYKKPLVYGMHPRVDIIYRPTGGS